MTQNDLSNIHFYIQGIMNRFYTYVNIICDIPERWWHFIKIQCLVIILCIHGEMLFWTAVLRTALAEHLILTTCLLAPLLERLWNSGTHSVSKTRQLHGHKMPNQKQWKYSLPVTSHQGDLLWQKCAWISCDCS